MSSSSIKTKILDVVLINKEISMEEFIREHMNQENQGNILQVYETTASTLQPKPPATTSITTKYNTLCFKFADGKYYSARRISFTNQLCSSGAKPQQADAGKEPKYVTLRFHEFKRSDIASGDYVMPKTDELSEEQIIELTNKYNKNIDDLVRSNELLKAFHIAFENEWQLLNNRLKNTFDTHGNPTVLTLGADKLVRSSIISKVEITDKSTAITTIKIVDPPLYTWKIPVVRPHGKSGQNAHKHKDRLGQVYMKDDKFEPAVYDMEASKEASKGGKKNLVEARIKGVRNGQPCEEALTCYNVSKYITRKSRMGGYLDVSQSSVSGQGHCSKIQVPHLIVKRHKTAEKDTGTSDDVLDELYQASEGYAEVGDDLINLDDPAAKHEPEGKNSSRMDSSQLDNIPLGVMHNIGQPQQYPQQYGQQPQQYSQYGQNQPYVTQSFATQPQYANQLTQQMQQMQMQVPQQQAPMQQPPMQQPPMQQPPQYGNQPNLNYASIVNSGLTRPQ